MHDSLRVVSESISGAAGSGRSLPPRGSGQWWPAPDGPNIDCSSLVWPIRADGADLVATSSAGTTLESLAAACAAAGTWLVLDPPGPATRTLGGVLASGGGGPLSALFGTPRDQVLGLTFAAGNGRIVRSGGRVVKNVAGFDLAKAVIGSHGAFGVIAEAHLRLRALPERDLTGAWAGPREAVAAAAAGLLSSGSGCAAVEAVDGGLAAALGCGDEWTLLVRAMGTARGADEELAVAAAAAAEAPGLGEAAAPRSVWDTWRKVVGGWPVVVRMGSEPTAWRDACDLAASELGEPLGVSVTVPRGTVRLGFDSLEAGSLRRLRDSAGRRRWPVMLERADEAIRRRDGVWGGMPAGTLRIAEELRSTFDPDGVFEVPLWEQ